VRRTVFHTHALPACHEHLLYAEGVAQKARSYANGRSVRHWRGTRTESQFGGYRAASKLHLHIIIVLPVLSFSLAIILQQYGDYLVDWLSEFLFGVEIRKAVTLGLLGYLALMHYYTEAFTWKSGSPYRQFIAFKK